MWQAGATLQGARQAGNAIPPRVDTNFFSGAGRQADDMAGQRGQSRLMIWQGRAKSRPI